MARLILDRYRPMGTAGAGGFGTVQIAWDTRIQRTVAIKIIKLTEVEAARAASPAATDSAYRVESFEPLDARIEPHGGWLDDVCGEEAGGIDGIDERAVEGAPTRAIEEVEPPPWDDAWDAADPASAADAFCDADDYSPSVGSGTDGDADAAAVVSPVASPADAAWVSLAAKRHADAKRKSGPLADLGARFGRAGGRRGDPAGNLSNRTVVFSREPAVSDAAGTPGDAAADEGMTWEEAHWLANVPGLDEARTAAMLSDPNIVAVYDFEVQGSTAYLIMEYVDGLTLTQVLRNYDDDMTLDIVASVLADVAHALEVAHKNQVLHLDIKPDNILVDGEGRAKVTDFGLATLADAQGLGSAGGGTIGYMPFEQLCQRQLDARSDEWALASVVYEMLVGENPFRARTLEQAKDAVRDAELVVPSLCWDNLDADVDDVLFYALDPNPDERYETVREFADELAPYLGSAKRGKVQLAALVAGIDESQDDQSDDAPAPAPRERKPRVPLSDRLTPRVCAAAAHAFGAIASTFVMALALGCAVSGGAAWAGTAAACIALAVAAVLGAVRPHAGALASFLALGVALAFAQAPVAGVAVAAASIAWWVFAGRGGNAQANIALAFPLLVAIPVPGSPGLAAAAALAAGGFLRVRDAVIAVAFGFVAVVALSGASAALFGGGAQLAGGYHASAFVGAFIDAVANGPDAARFAAAAVGPSAALDAQNSIADVLLRPETWLALAGWAAAAALFAACCKRGSRALAIAGALLGATVIAACAVGGAAIAAGGLPDAAAWVAGVAPSVACGVGAAALIKELGVPVRR